MAPVARKIPAGTLWTGYINSMSIHQVYHNWRLDLCKALVELFSVNIPAAPRSNKNGLEELWHGGSLLNMGCWGTLGGAEVL